MTTSTNRMLILGTAFPTIAVVILLGWSEVTGGQARDDKLIATVDSEEISYSAIKITRETARNRFVYENERTPVTDSDFEEMERIRRMHELKALAKEIRLVVRSEQMSRLGVGVTDEEVDARLKELLRERDPPSVETARHTTYATLLEALIAVHEDSENPDDVYTRLLADSFPPEFWKAAIRQYRTSESRRLLEQAVNNELPESDYRSLARRILLRENMAEAIIKELIRTDPEFAEYRRSAATNPQDPIVQSRGPNYVTAKSMTWWDEQYRKADVKIIDPRFEPVLELFASVPASRNRETSKR